MGKTPPAGMSINLHPIGLAAWFGFFATALNLLPVGQLDGGHVSYALFGGTTQAHFSGVSIYTHPVGPVLLAGMAALDDRSVFYRITPSDDSGRFCAIANPSYGARVDRSRDVRPLLHSDAVLFLLSLRFAATNHLSDINFAVGVFGNGDANPLPGVLILQDVLAVPPSLCIQPFSVDAAI